MLTEIDLLAERLPADDDARLRAAYRKATTADDYEPYDPEPLPKNRRSGSSAFDDLTLTMERVTTLIEAINDVAMHREERNLVSLVMMAKMEIEYANSIALANARNWS